MFKMINNQFSYSNYTFPLLNGYYYNPETLINGMEFSNEDKSIILTISFCEISKNGIKNDLENILREQNSDSELKILTPITHSKLNTSLDGYYAICEYKHAQTYLGYYTNILIESKDYLNIEITVNKYQHDILKIIKKPDILTFLYSINLPPEKVTTSFIL